MGYKNYDNYSDDELMYLISESNEDAKDILYEKYKYIIDVVFNRYRKACYALGLEPSDFYQEALLGFSDAIARYREDKSTKISTFITLCVDRRLKLSVIKASRLKYKVMNESLSIDGNYGPDGLTLEDFIKDNNLSDPLDDLVKEELVSNIKDNLSSSEYEVYLLMIRGYNYNEIASLLNKNNKSVDNTIQRIKSKIRKILDND